MEDQRQQLLNVLSKYGVADPKIVGKLPKGGRQLDFVGHADITRILIEIDPLWRLVPIAWENGRPAFNIVNDMAIMWFEMTLLGVSRLAIGSEKANATELDKILYGDALRNGAMRFGISLNLWTKNEWDDLNNHPAPASFKKSAPKAVADVEITSTIPVDPAVIAKFIKACTDANIDHDKVADYASVDLTTATNNDMNKLRAAFKEMSQTK